MDVAYDWTLHAAVTVSVKHVVADSARHVDVVDHGCILQAKRHCGSQACCHRNMQDMMLNALAYWHNMGQKFKMGIRERYQARLLCTAHHALQRSATLSSSK